MTRGGIFSPRYVVACLQMTGKLSWGGMTLSPDASDICFSTGLFMGVACVFDPCRGTPFLFDRTKAVR